MDRSSIRADYSNKIYDDSEGSSSDRFSSLADDRIADAAWCD